MAGNSVKLEFAGDADKLAKASKQAQGALGDVEDATKGLTEENSKAGKESANFTDKIGKLGAGVSGMSDAIDQAGSLLSDFNQIQNAGYEKAQRLARAQSDVEQALADQKQAAIDARQATEDLAQAQLDGKQAAVDSRQAAVDLEQAQLDNKNAHDAYLAAVKKSGAGSKEAQQALIDYKQTAVDVAQAQADQEQATRDANQATIDQSQAVNDGKQATIDAKNAQLDLNDAQREAHPPDTEKWAQDLETFTPLLQGLVGIFGLVTAAQWAWNAAQLASPTTWIVAGIVALIAIVVLLVKHWDKVKKAGEIAWHGILVGAKATWDFLKRIPGWLGQAFGKIAEVISWPYRKAFNLISDAWNHTIGRLSWSVPGWVPFIGGNTISVPQLPHFHSGIDSVPGAPGSEMLAVLQAGERVIPASQNNGDDTVHVVVKIDRDTLLDIIAKGNRRGGPRLA